MPTISPARTANADVVGTRRAAVRPSTSSSTSPTGVSTFGNSVTARPTMWRMRSAVVSVARRRRDDVLPSRNTVARSHSSKTSSRRWLTNSTATPRSRSLADDREQPLDLVGRQRRRRLVEDQDPRLDRQRLGDLDQLLVGHRQAADRRPDVEPDVELRRTASRARRRIAPQSTSEAARSARGPMKTFSATDRSGNSRGSWWTTAMPSARAWAGPARTIGSPSSTIVPLSGWWMPAEDLDQRALAGAVLADERVDLAGAQLQRHVGERLRRPEPLRDAAQGDGAARPGRRVRLGAAASRRSPRCAPRRAGLRGPLSRSRRRLDERGRSTPSAGRRRDHRRRARRRR